MLVVHLLLRVVVADKAREHRGVAPHVADRTVDVVRTAQPEAVVEPRALPRRGAMALLALIREILVVGRPRAVVLVAGETIARKRAELAALVARGAPRRPQFIAIKIHIDTVALVFQLCLELFDEFLCLQKIILYRDFRDRRRRGWQATLLGFYG